MSSDRRWRRCEGVSRWGIGCTVPPKDTDSSRSANCAIGLLHNWVLNTHSPAKCSVYEAMRLAGVLAMSSSLALIPSSGTRAPSQCCVSGLAGDGPELCRLRAFQRNYAKALDEVFTLARIAHGGSPALSSWNTALPW